MKCHRNSFCEGTCFPRLTLPRDSITIYDGEINLERPAKDELICFLKNKTTTYYESV